MRKWETEKRGNEEMNWKWSSFDLKLRDSQTVLICELAID